VGRDERRGGGGAVKGLEVGVYRLKTYLENISPRYAFPFAIRGGEKVDCALG